MSSTDPKVTCFHDGECPICQLEVKAMQKLDAAGNIQWVDINQDKEALARAGITYKQAMQRLHVMDSNQQLQTGVLGFIQLWQQLPYYRRLVPIVQRVPLLLPLLECCYSLFARYRLPLTGKPQIKD